MNDEFARITDDMFVSIKGYVGRSVATLLERLATLEARAPIPGPQGAAGEKGLDGRNGIDGGPGERGEKGMDGRNGIDGKDGTKGAEGERGEKGLDGMRGADGLNGKDGAPGERGEKGIDGRNGTDGVDGSPGSQGLQGETGPEGPPGRDGRDGAPGVDGQRGERGLVGKDGLDGKDGRDGEDGRNGLDGFQLDDFDAELKDGRELIIKLKSGERTIHRSIRLPIPLDRGVYRSGARHREGDGVTWGGSFWIAQRDTASTPGGDSPDWRLAVKRGRDAKEAK